MTLLPARRTGYVPARVYDEPAPEPLPPVRVLPPVEVLPAPGVIVPRGREPDGWHFAPARRHGATVTTRKGASVSLGYEPPPPVHDYAPPVLKRLVGAVALTARGGASISLSVLVVVVCWLVIGAVL